MGQIINQFPGGGEDVTAEVEVQTPLVDQIMTALIGKVGDDANATAETILEGYKAWVQGEKIIGTFVPITGIDYGKVTLQSPSNELTFNHNLGKVPSQVFINSDNIAYSRTNKMIYPARTDLLQAVIWVDTNMGTVKPLTTLNETTVTCPSYNDSNLWYTGSTFTWVVIA